MSFLFIGNFDRIVTYLLTYIYLINYLINYWETADFGDVISCVNDKNAIMCVNGLYTCIGHGRHKMTNLSSLKQIAL